MRIGVIRISQETDTFNPNLTTRGHFESFSIDHGQDVIDRAGPDVVRGYLQAANERGGVETVPMFKARAVAGGRVEASMYEYLATELEKALREVGDLDGLALLFHGACSAEDIDDVEGQLLIRARAIVGPNLPIVMGLDHHANITQLMVDELDALVGHRTQPHQPIDTGLLTGHLLFRIVAGEVSPAMRWRKIPLISHQEQYLTSQHPMKTWFDKAREIEAEDPKVLQISNFPMQPWLDVDEGGWATVVVTDNDPDLADQIAAELGDLAWSMREEFQVKTSVPPAQAVAAAEAAAGGVVVLSDTGDSVLGGAGGDSTVLLREMLEQGIQGPALVPMVHTNIGELLAGSAVGDFVTIDVGGSVALMHEPITLTGTLKYSGPTLIKLTEGYGSPGVDVGHAAVINVACGTVVITQYPGVGGVVPAMYHHFGIDPSTYKMAVVKTASNFQHFAPMTTEVIRADTPGPTQSEISMLPWERIPRPVFPLDEMTDWR
jgi:microcystin degradation protein MlrC